MRRGDIMELKDIIKAIEKKKDKKVMFLEYDHTQKLWIGDFYDGTKIEYSDEFVKSLLPKPKKPRKKKAKKKKRWLF